MKLWSSSKCIFFPRTQLGHRYILLFGILAARLTNLSSSSAVFLQARSMKHSTLAPFTVRAILKSINGVEQFKTRDAPAKTGLVTFGGIVAGK